MWPHRRAFKGGRTRNTQVSPASQNPQIINLHMHAEKTVWLANEN